MTSNPREHWQEIHQSKTPTEVSWYEPIPVRSLSLIQSTGLPPAAAVLDVGAGASTLVDHLLAAGFRDLTVLDIAPAALEAAKARLGTAGDRIQWIAEDVTEWRPPRRYDLWHDRAVFHFLIDETKRDRYLDVLKAAILPGGWLVMATFGPDGPTRCSGLDVRRYSAAELTAVLGAGFRLVRSVLEQHSTPQARIQQFQFGLWRAED